MKNKENKYFLLPERHIGRVFSLGATVLLLILLIYMTINLSGWNMGRDRIWFAFKQHYALAQVESGRYNLNPWFDYNSIIGKDFPKSHSLLDALFIKPSSFISHLLNNCKNLPRVISEIIQPFFYLKHETVYFVSWGFCFIMSIFLLRRRKFIIQAKNIVFEFGNVAVLCFLSPLALIPSLIVYTKPIYSLMIMPSLLLLFGAVYIAFFKSHDSARHKLFINRALLILIAIIFLTTLIMPKPFRRGDSCRPVYENVLKVKKIWPRTKTKLLGAAIFFYCNYIGRDDRCIPILISTPERGDNIDPGGVNLYEMIAHYKPDAVLINGILLHSENFDQESLKIFDSQSWTANKISDEETLFFKNK